MRIDELNRIKKLGLGGGLASAGTSGSSLSDAPNVAYTDRPNTFTETQTFSAGSAIHASGAGQFNALNVPQPTAAPHGNLAPAALAGAPSYPSPQPGDYTVDANGALWIYSGSIWRACGRGSSWEATDYGLKYMAFDPALLPLKVTALGSFLIVVRIPVANADTVSTIHTYVTAAGSGFVSGQSKLALYDSNNVLLASGDASGALASTGLRSVDVGSTSVNPPAVYAVLLVNASSPPSLLFVLQPSGSYTPPADLVNLNGVTRYGYISGQTSLPLPLVPSNLTLGANPMWFGLS